MAEHGESAEKGGGKHGSWLDKIKHIGGFLGMATLAASLYLTTAAGIVFPPYILAYATGVSALYLYNMDAPKVPAKKQEKKAEKKKEEKKADAGHGHH